MICVHRKSLRLFAKDGLQQLNQSKAFDSHYADLHLMSKKIVKRGNKLHAEVTFSFDHQEQLLDLMYFTNHPQNGNIVYPVLELEQLITTNGQLFQEDQIKLVAWEPHQRILHLTLKYQRSSDRSIDVSVNLADYWDH